MKRLFVVALGLISVASAISPEQLRGKKSISLFSVVSFPNAECQSTKDTTMQGTCLSSTQCGDRGGTAQGNCGYGFGVCCMFTIDAAAGGTVSQNITYIQNNGYPTTYTTASQTITYSINALSSEICQIRYDFVKLQLGITGTTGVCSDTFTITSPTGSATPQVCGTFTSGDHLYSDVGMITGTATTAVIVTGTSTTQDRNWKVKISQIECSNSNMAPSGCHQYYTKSSGTLESFNFPQGLMIGVIGTTNYCFKKASGMCGMAFTVDESTTTPTPFTITASATTPTPLLSFQTLANCAIATLLIPNVSNTPNSSGGAFCGTKLNIIANAPSNGIIFNEAFMISSKVFAADVKSSTGFKLSYSQRAGC